MRVSGAAVGAVVGRCGRCQDEASASAGATRPESKIQNRLSEPKDVILMLLHQHQNHILESRLWRLRLPLCSRPGLRMPSRLGRLA